MFIKVQDISKQHDRDLERMYNEIQKRQANLDKAIARLKDRKDENYEYHFGRRSGI